MYDIIKEIIDHTWNTTTNNSTEQQVIYYIVGALIIILTTVFLDLIYRIFNSIMKKGY